MDTEKIVNKIDESGILVKDKDGQIKEINVKMGAISLMIASGISALLSLNEVKDKIKKSDEEEIGSIYFETTIYDYFAFFGRLIGAAILLYYIWEKIQPAIDSGKSMTDTPELAAAYKVFIANLTSFSGDSMDVYNLLTQGASRY
jgi:hypothetical protein